MTVVHHAVAALRNVLRRSLCLPHLLGVAVDADQLTSLLRNRRARKAVTCAAAGGHSRYACDAGYNVPMRYRLRTLLVVLLLRRLVIALYVTAMLAARDVARDRALLEKERADLKELASQRLQVTPGYGTPQKASPEEN